MMRRLSAAAAAFVIFAATVVTFAPRASGATDPAVVVPGGSATAVILAVDLCPKILKFLDPVAITCLGTGTAAAPNPGLPGSGTPGQFDPGPAGGTGVYGTQGYAGLTLPNYDTPSYVTATGRAVNASIEDAMGDRVYSTAVDIIAATNGLGRAIDPPTFLHALDGLVARATVALYKAIFVLWIDLAVSLVALGMLYRAWRRDHASLTRSSLWLVTLLGAVAWVLASPVVIGGSADNFLSTTNDNVYAAVDGQAAGTPSAAGNLAVDEVLIPTWYLAELGSTTGPTVTTYGPKLLQANGYTWAMTKGGTALPSDADTTALNHEWQVAAHNVAQTCPTCFDHMTGNLNGRTSASFMALIGALLTSFFRLAAYAVEIGALLYVRFGVILLAPVALLSVEYRFNAPLRELLTSIAVAVVAAVAFAAGAAVDTAAVGFLLNPAETGLAWPIGAGIAVVATWGLWRFMRPVRTILRTTASAVGTTARTARHHLWAPTPAPVVVVGAVAGAVAGPAAGRAAQRAAINARNRHTRPTEAVKAEPVEADAAARPAPRPRATGPVDDNPLAASPDRPRRAPTAKPAEEDVA